MDPVHTREELQLLKEDIDEREALLKKLYKNHPLYGILSESTQERIRYYEKALKTFINRECIN